VEKKRGTGTDSRTLSALMQQLKRATRQARRDDRSPEPTALRHLVHTMDAVRVGESPSGRSGQVELFPEDLVGDAPPRAKRDGKLSPIQKRAERAFENRSPWSTSTASTLHDLSFSPANASDVEVCRAAKR